MELKEHFTRESTDAFSLWMQLSSDNTYHKLAMPYWNSFSILNSFSTPNPLSMTWWHSTKYGTSDSRKRWSSSLGAGSYCHCPTCQGSVVPLRATLGNRRISKYSIYCISLSYHGISEKKIFQANHPKSWTTYIHGQEDCEKMMQNQSSWKYIRNAVR